MPRNMLARNGALSIALCLMVTFAFGQAQDIKTPHRFQLKYQSPIVHGATNKEARRSIVTNSANSGTNPLPVWNYEVLSSRDGNIYDGVIVGRNPSSRGADATANVPTQVIPIILKFHTVGTAVDFNTGVVTTTAGYTTSDPTAADTGCFVGPNNVPLKLMEQSPIFKNADFNFGGTDIGTTQYADAFSRGNFWQLIDKANYHTIFSPVKIFAPVVVDVPAKQGLALAPNVFAPAFTLCGPEGLVDINFLDNLVVNELSQLKGINPGTFPMFMIYNTGMSIGDPTNINNCCAGGYHGVALAGPLTFQAYSPFDFDVSGLFVSSASDTAIVSHEANEFVNDPYDINPTPAWGNVGQDIGACQNNLEVGDPLTGSEAPRIAMPNGYTYHLQELAFFSWFYGAPSLAVHGWYSDNGTFLTDAGPPCQ
jgi:hypothetical protein